MISSHLIADILLDIQAVKLDPVNLFTWTSGIKSPIYCDNRQIISYPSLRRKVVEAFCQRAKAAGDVDVVAGTATAGIPWAAWIADKLELPMVYVRGGAKGHGLKNAIEGKYQPGQKALVVEDLISTGKSSIDAVEKLRDAGLEVLEVVSIFTYDFDIAERNFSNAGAASYSLCGLGELLERAQSKGLLSSGQIGIIREWKNNKAKN